MRKLVAVLACRAASSRLYCKPLQSLSQNVTLLDNIVRTLREQTCISEIVLAIAEGPENECFRQFAKLNDIRYLFGSEKDVLKRLIDGGRIAAATDVFRVTTESPFVWKDPIEGLWLRHLDNNNDISVTDNLPIGSHCEIYTLASLELSHRQGADAHRSELCSLYARQNPDQFKIESIWPDHSIRRPDIRLTVDFPEDLIVCRDIFKSIGSPVGAVDIFEVVKAFDTDERYRNLLASIPKASLFWSEATVTPWSGS